MERKGTGFHHLRGAFCPRSLRFPSETLGETEAFPGSPLYGSHRVTSTSSSVHPFQAVAFLPTGLRVGAVGKGASLEVTVVLAHM